MTDYKDRQKISDLQLISIRYLVKLVPKSKGQRGGGVVDLKGLGIRSLRFWK